MLTHIEGLGEVELLPLPSPIHKYSKPSKHQQHKLDFMCHGIDKPVQYPKLLHIASSHFGRKIRDLANLTSKELKELVKIVKSNY